MSAEILSGVTRGLGMLFVGWFMYASYKVSRDFAEKEIGSKSWKHYVFVLVKWVAVIAAIAFIAASIAGKGGCDSFDNCTDPDPNPAPLAETWGYFFTLIIVPAMIGLYSDKRKNI